MLPTLSTGIQLFSSVTCSVIIPPLFRHKPFLTLTAWIQLSRSMYSFVHIQISPCCIPFVTHCTQIRSLLVIMWMLSDGITIGCFSLNFKGTSTCKIYTLWYIILCFQMQNGTNEAVVKYRGILLSSVVCNIIENLIYKKNHLIEIGLTCSIFRKKV